MYQDLERLEKMLVKAKEKAHSVEMQRTEKDIYHDWTDSELRRLGAATPLPGSPELSKCVDFAIRAMKTGCCPVCQNFQNCNLERKRVEDTDHIIELNAPAMIAVTVRQAIETNDPRDLLELLREIERTALGMVEWFKELQEHGCVANPTWTEFVNRKED